ncbi:MAG: aminomethyl-transferring glycine dehydrogenase subunit GcvPA [Bacillota bacterium]
MTKYLPNTDSDRQEMLAAIRAESIEALFADIPKDVRFNGDLNLPKALSELEARRLLAGLAAKNAEAGKYACFLGAGTYDHYIPATVDHVISRSEFYSAYTPYQPEVSQGVLQSIFEYQTAICELTGLDVSNASMYDGATAMVEAVVMAEATNGRKRVVLGQSVHPEYRQTLKSYNAADRFDIAEVPFKDGVTDVAAAKAAITQETACVICQVPNFFGCIEDVQALAEAAHAAGALFIVVANPISLGLLEAPAAYGADIVCGEGQPMGNPMYYGGPHLGFFAAKEKLVRRMAGRIVGQTVDSRGQRAFVLTLQTREQHIRREKATSNICSNEALNALAALTYLCTLGKQGIKEVAEQCLAKAHYAHGQFKGKVKPAFKAPFFNEFVVKVDDPAKANARLLKDNILGGLDLGRFYPELKGHMLLAFTEKRTKAEIDALIDGLEGM